MHRDMKSLRLSPSLGVAIVYVLLELFELLLELLLDELLLEELLELLLTELLLDELLL